MELDNRFLRWTWWHCDKKILIFTVLVCFMGCSAQVQNELGGGIKEQLAKSSTPEKLPLKRCIQCVNLCWSLYCKLLSLYISLEMWTLYVWTWIHGKLLFRRTIFLYKFIVYIVLDYVYCRLYFASCKWPLALCCLINEWMNELFCNMNSFMFAVISVLPVFLVFGLLLLVEFSYLLYVNDCLL